ncbi:MAG: peptidylprolyl isomerase [Cellvibrionaceae bacterium]
MIKKITLVFALLLCSVQVAAAGNTLKLDVVTQKGKGTILIRLLPDIAPNHVKRIKKLTSEGAYDNVAFHRVIAGFMAQTGDVQYANKSRYDHKNAGTGGSTYPNLYAELSEISFKTGVVGMARNRYIHSANSQFFIMTETHPNLNGRYTVVGIVEKGLELVRKLKSGSQEVKGKVTDPDYIKKASII